VKQSGPELMSGDRTLVTVTGNVKQCSHCGKWYGSFKKKKKLKIESHD
jgi:hypothetical protein